MTEAGYGPPPAPLATAGSYDGIDFSTHVVLQSCDDEPKEFVCSKEACKMSNLIKDMLEDSPEGGSDPVQIPVPTVNADTLKYVVQYIEYHHANRARTLERPLKDNLKNLISPWDKAFLYTDLVKDDQEENHELLVHVIMGANFLNIKDLLDLTCACIANMIRGKSPEEIRRLFNITNDFTPEEEERIREENKWCEEAT